MITFSLLIVAVIVMLSIVLTFIGVFWFVAADIIVFGLIIYALYRLLRRR